jgi:hypothetical protein
LLHTLSGEGLAKESVLHIGLLTEDREIGSLLDAQTVGPRLANEIIFAVNVRDGFRPVFLIGSSKRGPGDVKKSDSVVRNRSVLDVLLLLVRISLQIVEKILRPVSGGPWEEG